MRGTSLWWCVSYTQWWISQLAEVMAWGNRNTDPQIRSLTSKKVKHFNHSTTEDFTSANQNMGIEAHLRSTLLCPCPPAASLHATTGCLVSGSRWPGRPAQWSCPPSPPLPFVCACGVTTPAPAARPLLRMEECCCHVCYCSLFLLLDINWLKLHRPMTSTYFKTKAIT